MEKMLKKPDYAKEILAIMHGSFSKEEMLDRIADYHENVKETGLCKRDSCDYAWLFFKRGNA